MATEYKLSYTANEINTKLGKIDRLAEKSEIPANLSELTNDAGFLTQHQSLADYAKKSEVPSNTETWTFTLEDGTTVTKAVYVG